MSPEPRPTGRVGVKDAPRGYASVCEVIDDRAVWTAFQPIVRLDTREVVGYEALSRGPAGTRWQDPIAMFEAARAVGRAGELDWICRARAHQAATRAGLHPDLALFVNVEPSTLREPCPPDLLPAFARTHPRVVMELTERDLAADPAGLLMAAAGHRAAGHGLALDDVGADPASLALMPFVHPDVVKLDMRLLHRPDLPQTAQVVNAVVAHAERTGALIVAEGIEREQHFARARSMGATLGQGWLLGHPAQLPHTRNARVRRPIESLAPDETGAPDRTPFEIVAGARAPGRATKQALLTTTRYLESKAADTADPPVLLACFQDARRFTAPTADRYARLAKESPFVAAFGVGFDAEPASGVRGAPRGPGRPAVPGVERGRGRAVLQRRAGRPRPRRRRRRAVPAVRVRIDVRASGGDRGRPRAAATPRSGDIIWTGEKPSRHPVRCRDDRRRRLVPLPGEGGALGAAPTAQARLAGHSGEPATSTRSGASAATRCSPRFPEPVDLVNVFRPSADATDVVRQAIEIGARAVWLQQGIVSPQGRKMAEAAGIDYVEDQCTAVVRAAYALTRLT